MSSRAPSAWSPLRLSLFRALWLAAVASNVGTWMHNVGAEWLMTTLAPTPIMVALMQTAENSPTFLLALPGGALADIVDRRRLLIFTQTWMLVAAVALGTLTLAGWTTPWVLLALTFMLGLGAALNAPAWQAIVPELVPRAELPVAVSLNSVAFNIARAVGPALGGLLVAAIGSWAVFFLNSLSFVGVIYVLYRWRRDDVESISPTERVVGAMRAGLRYARHAPELRAVLARTVVFVSCASALWALLPLLASRELGMGALGYGVLLGGLGAGAIVGAFVMQKARRALSTDALVGCGTLLFAAATAAVAYFQAFAPLCVAMVFGGVAWMTTMSCFNIGVQTVVPEWVRARALAVYLLSFFGTMAAGSAVWGLVAERAGIHPALLCAACGLVVGLAAALLFPLRAGERLDLNPSLHWSEPSFVSEIHPEHGPVLVTVEYLIDPERADEFAEAMRDFERILRRDGATRWGLFADPARPGRYLETFLVESWAEHLRQHARVTNEDRAVNERVRSFHLGDAPPVVTHLIAEDTSRRGRRRALEALSQLVSRR
ncbi:MAG: MFS transporter [Acidobacteriota bacterium]|nr:MFS transporter [Acidobacteriota bacterium]